METTGLAPESGDRIVEIAATRIRNKEILGNLHSLVNPDRLISPSAYEVNRISQEMLLNAPHIKMILPDFLRFISGSCLVSYNAPFDFGFLQNELALTGLKSPSLPQAIDLLRMARLVLPGLARYSLWFVARTLGINVVQKHRAFSDVQITISVFNSLKGLLKEKGILDFENLVSLFGLSSHTLRDINNTKISQIREAINLGLDLRLRYFSGSSGEVSEREVSPRQIKEEKKRRYLIGYCNLRKEERTFRIDNILQIEVV